MNHVTCRRAAAGVLFPLAVASVALLVCHSLGFAAEGAHQVNSSAQLKDFLYRVLNFALLAGILVWAVKKADVRGLLAARREAVAKTLAEAVQLREDAEQKLVEYQDKLARATREIDDIRAAILRDGELERQRIIADAQAVAVKIREQAEATARQEVQQARERLRGEAARLAVQLAETALRESVTEADQERFVQEYLAKLVEAP